MATDHPTRVLIVGEDARDFEYISELLGDAGSFDASWAGDRDAVFDRISEGLVDVALVVHGLGSQMGLDLIREAQEGRSSPPMIVVSGLDDERIDRAALDAGAADYLVRSQLTSGLLRRSVRYTVKHHVALSELRQSQTELEKAITDKNESLAKASHDLRTPLSAVIGLAELLRDPDQMFDTASRTEMIDTIVESGFEVSNLVEDLLTTARYESGQLKVVAVPVSLHAQVNQALETIGHSTEIEVRGDASRAKADPARVRQIIRNLLTNARNYGGDEVHVELDDHEGMARASIVDNGPGVPEGRAQSIFERSERGSEASVGIGLPISRELARHMGGDLRYVRVAGLTRFELLLAINEPSQAPSDLPLITI